MNREDRDKRDAEILRLHGLGLSMAEVAREVGMSKAGIQHALRRLSGAGVRKGPPDWLVYRHYDGNGVLLYIGYTDDYGTRERQHSRRPDCPWYRDVAVTTRTRYDSETAARRAERQAIRAEHPKHNRTYNRAA